MIHLPIISLDGTRAEPGKPGSVSTLVATLLAEQRDLTAVERFAQHHEWGATDASAARYQSLLPATPPAPGQQYAFEVDLDRCTGCKACVTACHSQNGLDDGETWRDVGLLLGGTRAVPDLQHVTTACHHCLDPACLVACPVNAYEKDSVTGIVKHLDDQCFGCQYCVLACPYDVPKYNAAKGIVRKCDMCSSRLAVQEPPACAQACPQQAIQIKLVEVASARADAEAALFLPAAPDPRITYPTTTYKTQRAFPRNFLPADYFEVSPQHPHWPLVVMLVLTQLSVGAFAAGWLLGRQIDPALAQVVQPLNGLTALLFGLVALAASTLHLGRPRYAYRAILGLGHSWMSREILAFGIYAALACAFAAVTAAAPAGFGQLGSLANWPLGAGVVLSGALALITSVMIYATLGREYWSFARTATRFGLTAALLGTATLWLSVALLAQRRPPDGERLLTAAGQLCLPAIAIIATFKLLWEAAIFRHLLLRPITQLKRSAWLMTDHLANVTLARFACGVLGGVAIPLLLYAQLTDAPNLDRSPRLALSAILFLACLAGELAERYLFFAAVAAPRMPGRIRG